MPTTRRSTGRSSGAPAQRRPESRPTTAPATPPRAKAPSRQESAPVVPAATTFSALGVPEPLVAALSAQGITAPFAIQAATVTSGLAGRDVLGRARTGAGKTLAFSLPLVARLSAPGAARRTPGHPRAVVLAPTRELAAQISAVLAPLTAAVGLTQTTIFGGVGQNPQVTALKRGVDIVVACPGRLEDLIRQGHANLSSVEITVLDEADHMADLGFLPGVRRLLEQTPAGGQRLLFSATLDGAVDVLVKRFMRDPERISVDTATAAPVEMDHHVLEVSGTQKPAVVRELAAGRSRTLLFTRTKHQAKKLARTLTAAGTPAVDLHGNLSQGARERHLAAFADGSARVLVATDIAARGIHVDDVALVVHVDPPADHKAYLHRSGRTARAGSAGVVVTVATPDQRGDVTALTRAAAIAPTRTRVESGHPLLREITGPPAELVEAPAAPIQAAPARQGRGRASSKAGQARPTGTSEPGGKRRSRGGASRSSGARGAATTVSTASTGTAAGRGTATGRGTAAGEGRPAATHSAAAMSARGLRRGRR